MVPTDFNTTDYQKGLVNIVSFFITNPKPSILVQPGKIPLYHPAVNSQSAAVLSSAFGQHRKDPFFPQLTAMLFAVIAAIPQQTIRFFNRPAHLTGNRGNRFDQGDQLGHIMAIGAGHPNRQWNPLSFRHQMVFRAFFTPVRGIGAGFCPPKTARTEAESTIALEKSIGSACRSLFNKRRWISSQTPASCQSRSRRQQVMPLPQPISLGKSSQPMPVLRTNRIPVNAARSGMDLRPGYRKRLFRFGMTGSIISHSTSSKIGFAMSSLQAYLSSVIYACYRTFMSINFHFVRGSLFSSAIFAFSFLIFSVSIRVNPWLISVSVSFFSF